MLAKFITRTIWNYLHALKWTPKNWLTNRMLVFSRFLYVNSKIYIFFFHLFFFIYVQSILDFLCGSSDIISSINRFYIIVFNVVFNLSPANKANIPFSWFVIPITHVFFYINNSIMFNASKNIAIINNNTHGL